jgi:7-carboxy-7-deazaguanine synthase
MLFPIPGNDVITVNEIFYSIQGESTYAGLPCVFIRLTGCNLRCSYCDTQYAWEEGKEMAVEQIMEQTGSFGCSLVEITGGEPLLQEETPLLAETLIRNGYRVLVETNGTQNIHRFPNSVCCIMDIKCPGSGESSKTDWENINRLNSSDEVKFVLADLSDYRWAKELVLKYDLVRKCPVHFSPVPGRLDARELARSILKDALPVRLHLQLHKHLWPQGMRGV